MIVVRVREGLGNQMFQYAVGRQLAIDQRTELFLDDSIYRRNHRSTKGKTRRKFGLDAFNVPAPRLGGLRRLIVLKLARRRYSYLRRSLRMLGFPWSFDLISERIGAERTVNPELAPFRGGNAFLDGYWQSERYFASIRNQLLMDFTFKSPASGENAALLERMSAVNSVCIHVRRTDYLYPENVAVRGICGLAYYDDAIELMRSRVSDPHFFAFSDDPEWTRTNFARVENLVPVNLNHGKCDWEDLRLMSHCNHFIIANSSFSWWGAWLGKHCEKIVVAPARWRADGTEDLELVPDGWIRI